MGTYTGSFPASPKDEHAFEEKEISKQKGFKGSKAVVIGFKAMTDDTTMDPFPAYKTNHDGTSAHGDTVHTPAGDSDLGVPKKARPFGGYASNTPPPKGRALPVRGEGPTTNSNSV